ncbi:pentapeptide repeat-containing protein [Rothia mucilaginosa]|jgi:hypothetical protein|nr:pentapeptide repeat-containing protein [Rothia mucilaginosa]
MPENVSPPSPNSQNQEDKKPRFNLYTWLFDNPERFFWVIVSLGLIGGLAALMVPNYIDWQISSKDPADTKAEEIKQKSISDLRLHILYITGGIIAILTLLQNSWKNQIDRRKIEDDIQKNKNDHDRQVRAERRSRYTKAVEQLANEKAAVRLGGIYTLVGLVDEWIADDTLESEEQQKEGQVIINNLCAYIRSPFPLAKNRDTLIPSNEVNYGIAFEEDSVRLREEQETRLSIFTEISNHLTVPEKNSENKENTWNKFSYNYRESLIFYPLGNLKFANPDFSGSEFYGEAVFHNSEFIGESNFTHARFKRSAVFTISRHNCITKFDNAIFHGDTYFIGAEFFSGVSFKNSVYGSRIIFSEDSEKRAKKTVFSVKSNPKEYNFEINGIAMVSKIETEQITVADDQVFTIPMGCELFDPEPLPAPKPEEPTE